MVNETTAKHKNRFFVYSEDTDVLVLRIYLVHTWEIPLLQVYMLTGPSNNFKSLPIHSAVDYISSNVNHLVGLHCLTGCDAMNTIFGVSKSNAFKQIICHRALGELESGFSLNGESICASFYDFYGQTSFEGTMKNETTKI